MTKLIAEIGWNFLGNMNLAKEMISAAKESGADYAKFQTWSTKDLKPDSFIEFNLIVCILLGGKNPLLQKEALMKQN